MCPVAFCTRTVLGHAHSLYDGFHSLLNVWIVILLLPAFLDIRWDLTDQYSCFRPRLLANAVCRWKCYEQDCAMLQCLRRFWKTQLPCVICSVDIVISSWLTGILIYNWKQICCLRRIFVILFYCVAKCVIGFKSNVCVLLHYLYGAGRSGIGLNFRHYLPTPNLGLIATCWQPSLLCICSFFVTLLACQAFGNIWQLRKCFKSLSSSCFLRKVINCICNSLPFFLGYCWNVLFHKYIVW